MVSLMLLLGVVAGLVRRGWLLVAAASVAAAIFNWSDDAYHDSGNALGFSVLIVALFTANGAVGMALSASAKWMLQSRSGSALEETRP